MARHECDGYGTSACRARVAIGLGIAVLAGCAGRSGQAVHPEASGQSDGAAASAIEIVAMQITGPGDEYPIELRVDGSVWRHGKRAGRLLATGELRDAQGKLSATIFADRTFKITSDLFVIDGSQLMLAGKPFLRVLDDGSVAGEGAKLLAGARVIGPQRGRLAALLAFIVSFGEIKIDIW